eukprot:c45417_g1_i1.p1 GENE.c45417_g1_i1~~c45417_g1_i1.p1  ORF type:complete len:427 (-),score=93.38 c45417_g1_i1:91-1347(-)
MIRACLLCVLWWGAAVARVDEMYLNTRAKTYFLSKFFFQQSSNDPSGSFTIEILAAPSNENVQLAVYNDEPESFQNYVRGHSCEEATQLQPDGPALEVFNATAVFVSGKITRDVRASDKPRAWFVVAFDCEDGVQSLRYKFHFKQSAGLLREFSYETRDSLPITVSFCLVFLGMSFLFVNYHVPQSRARARHPLVGILSGAIALKMFEVSLFTVHTSIFTENGVGSPGMLVLSQVVGVCAEACVLSLALVISTGWPISSSVLKHKARCVVTVTLFLLSYFALFVWDVVGRERWESGPSTVTSAGLIVILVRLVIISGTIVCLGLTFVAETAPQKRKLYREFAWLLVLWLILFPIAYLIARSQPVWNQNAAITVPSQLFSALCLGYFLWAMWPARAVLFVANPRSSNPDSESNSAYEDL